MDLHLQSQLGKKSAYISSYDPKLLFPIPRLIKRDELGLDSSNLPFAGIDIWNHYEVSWLNPKGKPQIAICQIIIPCESENIIESKSMKLYFNSFNNSKFDNYEELAKIITKDIKHAIDPHDLLVSDKLDVKLIHLNEVDCKNFVPHLQGVNLDTLDIECDRYQPHPDYLQLDDNNPNNIVCETLYSDLLKSNCLVTLQPDWGSVQIIYEGNKINHEGLLKYLISLRNHNEFHEQCVERIFNDIFIRCKPKKLTVFAKYTRRGGIDINPFRSTETEYITYPQIRLARH